MQSQYKNMALSNPAVAELYQVLSKTERCITIQLVLVL